MTLSHAHRRLPFAAARRSLLALPLALGLTLPSLAAPQEVDDEGTRVPRFVTVRDAVDWAEELDDDVTVSVILVDPETDRSRRVDMHSSLYDLPVEEQDPEEASKYRGDERLDIEIIVIEPVTADPAAGLSWPLVGVVALVMFVLGWTVRGSRDRPQPAS